MQHDHRSPAEIDASCTPVFTAPHIPAQSRRSQVVPAGGRAFRLTHRRVIRIVLARAIRHQVIDREDTDLIGSTSWNEPLAQATARHDLTAGEGRYRRRRAERYLACSLATATSSPHIQQQPAVR